MPFLDVTYSTGFDTIFDLCFILGQRDPMRSGVAQLLPRKR